METVTTSNALKAVQAGLNTQTTITSGQQVMLYSADGTPSGKVAASAPQVQAGSGKTYKELTW